jgi:hypothetical protein
VFSLDSSAQLATCSRDAWTFQLASAAAAVIAAKPAADFVSSTSESTQNSSASRLTSSFHALVVFGLHDVDVFELFFDGFAMCCVSNYHKHFDAFLVSDGFFLAHPICSFFAFSLSPSRRSSPPKNNVTVIMEQSGAQAGKRKKKRWNCQLLFRQLLLRIVVCVSFYAQTTHKKKESAKTRKELAMALEHIFRSTSSSSRRRAREVWQRRHRFVIDFLLSRLSAR